MSGDEGIRPWRCERGHVLGAVQRNGSGVRQLHLYREAVDLKSGEPPAEVDVMAVIDGTAEIMCSECGLIRTWVPGEEAIRQLLERVGRE